MFANPDFDLTAAKMSAQIDPSSRFLGPSALRGNEQRDLTKHSFSPLQGERRVDEEVQVMGLPGGQFLRRSGDKKSTGERSSLALYPTPSDPWLFDRQSSASHPAPSALSSIVQPNVGTSKFFDNPMHRSGLALAGAETTLRGWERGEVPPRGRWYFDGRRCEHFGSQGHLVSDPLGLRYRFRRSQSRRRSFGTSKRFYRSRWAEPAHDALDYR